MSEENHISWNTDFGSVTLDVQNWTFVAQVDGAPHIRGIVPLEDRTSLRRAQHAAEVTVVGRVLWGAPEIFGFFRFSAA